MTPPPPIIWQCRDRRLDLTRHGMIMGILNVTPDSFSDGGEHLQVNAALAHARQMVKEGAQIIDIGGESTRPGAAAVSETDELERTIPVIEALRAEDTDVLISIDTSKAAVARAALEAGADIINDIMALADPDMAGVAAESEAGLVLMHMQGTPRTMQQSPQYQDVLQEVRGFLQERMDQAMAAGVRVEQIVLDPGIGFGKSLEHNLELLRNLEALTVADRPVLLGVSRKSLFLKLLGAEVDDRLWPTVAVTAHARHQGVRLHRVHDVRPNSDALRMTEAILDGVE